ncbi:histidine phosphatase family protein [Streptomyces sp. NPDC005438]|uniref:histidine phosphatase family protein n=1 Tax=Streptomyces sp. NPDC005438 TaxID=3156880 RepID=UPI0033B871A1
MQMRLTLLATARSSDVHDTRFQDDRSLDTTGWKDVQQASGPLNPLTAAELRYCSPSPRARETGEALGLFPLAQPALRACDMGRWAGKTLHEVAESDSAGVDRWLSDPTAAPHGGESLLAFISRIGGWLDTRPADEGTWIVAVVEPTVVRAALCYALKAHPNSYWHIEPQPLSVTHFTGRPGAWNLSLPA